MKKMKQFRKGISYLVLLIFTAGLVFGIMPDEAVFAVDIATDIAADDS